MNGMTYPLVLVSVSMNAIAQILLARAMTLGPVLPPLSQPVRLFMSLATNGWLWLGLVCFGVSVALWLVVLTRVPVSLAYPMASLGYVIAAVLGVVFLGETVGLARIGGIALICCGVALMARTV